MNIILTGGTSQIGKLLTYKLRQHGHQVIEIGSYVVVDSTSTEKQSGNYMSLFEKRNGKYVCIRDMSSSIMPAEKK